MKPLFSLALFCTASVVSAQMASQPLTKDAPDAFGAYLNDVRPAVPPMAGVSFEWHDTHDFEDGRGDADFSVLEARAPVYFREMGNGAKVALGVDYALTNLDVTAGDYSWGGELHALYLPISYAHRPEGSRWFFLAQAAPGLRTDFNDIDGDDFAFRTFASAMRQINDELVLGVGAFFSYDVDEIFAVPGIGFTWKPNDQWLVSLIPPQFAVSWIPSDDWNVSAIFRPRSFLADINEDANNSPDIASVSYGRVSLAVRHRIFNSPDLWLNLNAGYTVYSEVELQRSGQSMFDGDLDQGFFAGAGIEVLGW
jgi:hypothetical protein